MKQIERNVILDLLPLYLAGEASPDTRALVEEYLASDPELAETAELAAAMQQRAAEIPVPIRVEDQVEAYREAQRRIQQRTLVWGALVAFGILSLLGLAMLAYSMVVPVP
ncbi:MAG: zf-HC2 domain-containing protein [Anaerolineae bacterium]|jgi:anti-sigma factor RsiW